MHEYILRGAESLEFRVEILARIDHIVRNDTLLSCVQVEQEHVQRLQPLFDSRLDDLPLV